MSESKVAALLLVDDHALFRDGLRELITHWGEFRVVGEATNGWEAVELCGRLQPDIVLMDVQMPVMDGVEAARRIRVESPATVVVMLTMSVEERDLFEALKQGARGYVLKNTSAQQLRERLHEVARGEVPLSGAIAARILDELNRQRSADAASSPEPVETLTEREVQILRLVAEGLSNEEIGARLFLSDQTIKKQLSGVLQKLHLANRVQAAAYAVRHKLAD
ncbi:MAG: response regulator transcription factor [Planctomycetes bacterium]|nr:response regulator transcription factor [Planctomycetota bacterium]